MAVETLLDNPWFIFQVFMFIGILFRILLPFAQKKYEGQNLQFDTRFLWLGVWSWITVQIEFMTLLSQDGVDVITLLPLKAVALIGFFLGLGNTETWNRIFGKSPPTPPISPSAPATTAPAQ